MDKARVVVFEDEPNIRHLLRIFLENEGHEVVGEAYDATTSRERLDDLANGTIEAEIGIVDNNLSGQGGSGNEDGAAICREVKERHLQLKTIIFSSNPTSNPYADYVFETKDCGEVAKFVTGLAIS